MHVGVAGSVANHSNGTLVASTATGGGYPCCFVTWLVRSKDLSHWEESKNNPMMGWPDWSDHVITPGSLLDTLGTASQKEIGRNLEGRNYSDINRSDQDMVELPIVCGAAEQQQPCEPERGGTMDVHGICCCRSAHDGLRGRLRREV